MGKAARNVIKHVKSKITGIIGKGDVVQIPLVLQDRGKLDLHHLTGVVVNVNDYYGMVQVAVATGVLKPWYVHHKLKLVSGLGNNVALMGLEDVLKNWNQMESSHYSVDCSKPPVIGRGTGNFPMQV
jgi:hypothetical protein